MRVLTAVLLTALTLPAAAREFRYLPGVAEFEGYTAVGEEVERLVIEARNPTTARAFLRKTALIELEFPVVLMGLPAGWFEVLSPVREFEYLDTGMRGYVGTYPNTPVIRERLAASCLDGEGQPIAAPLVLSGPDEAAAGDRAAVYGVDGLVGCWTAGGASVLIHERVADPHALVTDGGLTTRTGDAEAFRERAMKQAAEELSRLKRWSPGLEPSDDGDEE